MAQNVLRYNVAIVGKFFNKGSWVSEAWKKGAPRGAWGWAWRSPRENRYSREAKRGAPHWHRSCGCCVCGSQARHLYAAPGWRLLEGETRSSMLSGPINQHNWFITRFAWTSSFNWNAVFSLKKPFFDEKRFLFWQNWIMENNRIWGNRSDFR